MLETQTRILWGNKESEAEIKIISLDFTMPGECKANENEFEYLNLVKIYVDCAPLVLSIYTVVTCQLHSNPLSNFKQFMKHTLKFQ